MDAVAGMAVVRGFAAAALLALAACGCAQRADWIEGTLVTVDVNGVWRGFAIPARGGVQGDAELTVTQRGPKVTGDFRIRGTKVHVEGTVRGDVLSFAAPNGRFHAEATVTGDEMSGQGVATQGIEYSFKLSREP